MSQAQNTADSGRYNLIPPQSSRHLDRLKPSQLLISGRLVCSKVAYLGQAEPHLEQGVYVRSTIIGGRWRTMMCQRRRIQVEQKGVSELMISIHNRISSRTDEIETSSNITTTSTWSAMSASASSQPTFCPIHSPSHHTQVQHTHSGIPASRLSPFPSLQPIARIG